MNAEQLARDIKSLPEAHKTLDAAGVPNYDSSICERVAAVVRHKSINSEMNVQAHEELKRAGLGSRGMLHDCAKAVVDELLKLREARDPYLMEVIKRAHKQMSRVEPEGNGDISQRSARVVDELLKLRAENKQVITQECSLNTHRQLDRLQSGAPAERLDLRVGALVDELLKLRAQGEVNETVLSNHELREMRAKMMEVLNIGNVASTFDLVQRLITAYKDLQHAAKPKPKEAWAIAPSQCQGSYLGLFRVMRGNEDATPFPVSEPVARAICDDLNARGV